MKTLSIILLNIFFFIIAVPLALVFIGVFGFQEAVISCSLFGILAGFIIPKITKKKNNIDG